MSDLVERLRHRAFATRAMNRSHKEYHAKLDDEAADRIEALEAERDRLREALRDIVDFQDLPLEAKRPDVYFRLIGRARAAMRPER